jgi:H+-translocating NAD(P) transhydrogenase subunit alpha
MHIAVPKETVPGERRVALVPDAVKRLMAAKHTVAVEQSAGDAAGYADAAFTAVGATVAASLADVLRGADVVAKVRRPTEAEAGLIAEGGTVVCLVQAPADDAGMRKLHERGVRVLALERVPRITRAQSMDVLSSQATVAGYKAVLMAATALPRFLPMLTTAAGSIPPGRALILGAGVAGLQAIATARRLGAVVSAFDVRAAAREQVQSLGAAFVAAELVSAGAETAGGYAKEQAADEQTRIQNAIGTVLPEMDMVIATAAIPNRRAPILITEAMVATMKPGAVIVDVAAETGGNCALTRPGETVVVHGVTIVGTLDLPSTVPFHASAMFGRNMLTVLTHLAKDGALVVDEGDEITKAMLVVASG